VCGTAAERRATVRVANVDEFPGHIACDSASRSELVIPLIKPGGTLVGVLDIDSPHLDRFEAEDEVGLEKIAARLAAKL
jgi:GAF domain-containing protein